ncbi:MAG: NUDIX hydrolase [Pseudoclavibacter sp.]
MTIDSPAASRTVYAAGAVLWHEDVADDKVKVLVIHRGRHGDYSLPKGKVDPGETLPETAAREVEEETGYRATLGAPLGYIEYVMPNGRPKEVHYWTAEVDEASFQAHVFEPNDEVDAIEWVSLKKAKKLLSYDRDRELLEVFADRYRRGLHRTFAVLVLRHATAVPPQAWPGDDDSRPITARGLEQAETVVPILRAFGPEAVITSNAVRCRSTVAPISSLLGLTPQVERSIAQGSYARDEEELDEVVRKLIARRQSTVICSHSPVMPAIVRSIALHTATRPSSLARHAMLSTGECSVIHVPVNHPGAGVVAAETHGPIT